MPALAGRRTVVSSLVDVAAALVVVAMFVVQGVQSAPQWQRVFLAVLWLGPGVWVAVRLLPDSVRLADRRLREELAVTPLAPEAIAGAWLRRPLFMALIPVVLALLLYTGALILGRTSNLYLLFFLPHLVAWYGFQILTALLVLMLNMRRMMKNEPAGKELIWIVVTLGAVLVPALALSGLARVLFSLIGPAVVIVIWPLMLGLLFWLGGEVRRQWRLICRNYYTFD